MAGNDVKIQDPFARLRDLHLRALTFLNTDPDLAYQSEVRQEWLENNYYPALIARHLAQSDVESGATDILMDQIAAIMEREATRKAADEPSSAVDMHRKSRLMVLLREVQECLDSPDFDASLMAAYTKEYPSFDRLRDQKTDDLDELAPALRQYLKQHGWDTGPHANRLVQAYEELGEQMKDHGTVRDEHGSKRVNLAHYKAYSRMLVQGFLGDTPYTAEDEKQAQQLAALTMDAQLQTVMGEIPETDHAYIAKETGLSLRDIAFRLHDLHAENAVAAIRDDASYYRRWNDVFPEISIRPGHDGAALKERVLKQFAQRLDEAALVGDVGRNWREELTEIGYVVAKATVIEKEGMNARLQDENAELKRQIEALERAHSGMTRAERYLQAKNGRSSETPPPL